jgi:ATP-dependent metalloprotease FtsH
MSEQNKQKNGLYNKGNKPGKSYNFMWIYAIIAVLIIGSQFLMTPPAVKEFTQNDFEEIAKDGFVEKITIVNKEQVEVFIKKERIDDLVAQNKKYEFIKKQRSNFAPAAHIVYTAPEIKYFMERLDKINESLAENGQPNVIFNSDSRTSIWSLFSFILPILIIVAIWIFMMRRMGGGAGGAGQIFNIGKSRAQLFDKGKSTNITFKDVAGLEGAKEEIQEIVEFLKSPNKYTELGAKIPKGALLVGPPGTGKTLLAKAVAGEAQVPFFSLSGSDFVEMFVGVGASRVRDLFKQAKEKAPAIIFIDEIDAIGRARSKGVNMGSNDERENTLNQLLTEMDGFGTNSGVIILAATNRADVLDRALMRAGRFDRQIYVDMPDLNERKEIFQVHLKPLKLGTDLDIDFLSKQTPGFSGADIANLCNEAALIAARKKKSVVETQDFLDAVDRIIGGLEKKNKIITKDEKYAIAIHEAGHASISWLLEHASPLVKVTIVPRGQSLGAAWYLPEERSITRTEQLLDEMCSALGGRAAELVTFGKISTGALSDLEKVTKQSYAMVSMYGLSEKIGNISYYDSQGRNEYSFSKPYSEQTAKTIDEEVSAIIEKQYQRAIQLLKENKDKLEALAQKLLEKEVIFKDDLEAIFGKRMWGEKETLVPNVVENITEGNVESTRESDENNSSQTDHKQSNDSNNSLDNLS